MDHRKIDGGVGTGKAVDGTGEEDIYSVNLQSPIDILRPAIQYEMED